MHTHLTCASWLASYSSMKLNAHVPRAEFAAQSLLIQSARLQIDELHIDNFLDVEHGKQPRVHGKCFIYQYCKCDRTTIGTLLSPSAQIDTVVLDMHSSTILLQALGPCFKAALFGSTERRVRVLRVERVLIVTVEFVALAALVAPWVETLEIKPLESFYTHAAEPARAVWYNLSFPGTMSLDTQLRATGLTSFILGKARVFAYAPAWWQHKHALWTYETHAAYPPVFRASVRTLYALARVRRAGADVKANSAHATLACVPDELLVELVRALACTTYARLYAMGEACDSGARSLAPPPSIHA